MCDSSEEEDLSKFKEAVDSSFTKLINDAKTQTLNGIVESKEAVKHKSERYLDVASHYNDVKVPQELQRQIGAKISALLNKSIEFVQIEEPKKRKRKIKGGVKLFKDSSEFLTNEEAQDTYTEAHNMESKKIKKKRRKVDPEEQELDENEKISAVAVTGDYIISKEATKCWKSRRKEKLFKYKSQGKSKKLVSID